MEWKRNYSPILIPDCNWSLKGNEESGNRNSGGGGGEGGGGFIREGYLGTYWGWGLLRVWALIWGDVVYAHGLGESLTRVKEKFLIDG